jgi:hypothetical protein
LCVQEVAISNLGCVLHAFLIACKQTAG